VVDVGLNDELAEDAVACVREGLTNVAKHARATSATVDVAVAADELTITISDNGVGPGDSTRSSGTANLQRRAEKRGGSASLSAGTAGGAALKWKVRIT
jgi:signal transduction histidine kinase